MKVTYQAKSLEFDDKPLRYYNLEENSELQVVRIECLFQEKSIIRIEFLDMKKEPLQMNFLNSMLI
jgi:hypothetical protein